MLGVLQCAERYRIGRVDSSSWAPIAYLFLRKSRNGGPCFLSVNGDVSEESMRRIEEFDGTSALEDGVDVGQQPLSQSRACPGREFRPACTPSVLSPSCHWTIHTLQFGLLVHF